MLRTPYWLANWRSAFGSFAAAVLIAFVSVRASEPQIGEAETVSTDLRRWAEQLDAPEFAQRQEASQKLAEAGRDAFGELERVAAERSREASDRALEILKGQLQRGDPEAQAAARASLERLSKNELPSLAQRARQVLDPPPPPALAQPLQRGVRLQLQVVAPAIKRGISLRNVNGRPEVEITENGRSQKLRTTPDGKIEVELTETLNGKATTRKIAAKDLDDLRRQDAELARSYERYGALTRPRPERQALPR